MTSKPVVPEPRGPEAGQHPSTYITRKLPHVTRLAPPSGSQMWVNPIRSRYRKAHARGRKRITLRERGARA